MYRLRRQIFRQIVQKARRNPVGFQAPFVQYGGKDASNMCIKAYAAIYSEVPLSLRILTSSLNQLKNEVRNASSFPGRVVG